MAFPESLVGKVVGSFEILREVGRGGMGIVYKAHEQSLQRVVALKVLPQHLAQDPAFVHRFMREARAAAQLNHPNIVTIHAVGEDAGLYYIAMEYVKGQSLKELICRQGRLKTDHALHIARHIADALAEAHAHGVIHRDIKPQNIMLDRVGRVKVMDFGLAKVVKATTDLTQTGSVMGTPIYMSPEQIQGREVEGRTDIYSLGVVLYEMLTGAVPFEADTPLALMYQIVQQPLGDPRKRNPAVPAEVVELIDRMTAKSPEHRFRSSAELSAALSTCLKVAPGTAIPVPAVTPASPSAEIRPVDVDNVPGQRAAKAQVSQITAKKRPVKTDWKRAGLAVVAGAVLSMVVLAMLLLTRPKPFQWKEQNGEAVLTLPGGVKMEFVGIPAGTFLMGSSLTPEEAQKRYNPPFSEAYSCDLEHPRHRVTLTEGFWMQKHELTNAQFEAFVRETGYATTAEQEGGGQTWSEKKGVTTDPGLSWRTPGWNIAPDQPVVFVTWRDAKAFCDWLSSKRGLSFQLPTEAQWEYAYRAGTTTEYFWGDDKTSYGEYAWDQVLPPPPVAGKKPNPWGLYDIEGNVVEWCRDGYEPWYYAVSPEQDPPGPGTRDKRVNRWDRAPHRRFDAEDSRWKDVGFRVCMEPDHDITRECKFTPPVLPKDLPKNPRVQWFKDAKWGVLLHYVPSERIVGEPVTVDSWNRAVDGVNVRALADQLASAGAGYCIFTIGQNSGYYCSPSPTYDRFVGVSRSKCSRRDLIADLADALNAKGIRLIAYLFSQAPDQDKIAAEALAWNHQDSRKRTFQYKWRDVIREWSICWQSKVSGWWFDVCNDARFNFLDPPNFQTFITAARTGNPNAIVSFNRAPLPIRPMTMSEDFTGGEVDNPAEVQYSGAWVDMQFHMVSYLGAKWGSPPPRFQTDEIIEHTRRIVDKGGVVTWDVPVESDGTIQQAFMDQLVVLGKAMGTANGSP
jgi:formylglycine-generating enzyme required for sulfatase activity/predicted Ser/Thr protein kinase